MLVGQFSVAARKKSDFITTVPRLPRGPLEVEERARGRGQAAFMASFRSFHRNQTNERGREANALEGAKNINMTQTRHYSIQGMCIYCAQGKSDLKDNIFRHLPTLKIF